MARILGIGIATIDIINHVSHYPAEDEEMRALSQQQVRGGNATNTLVVLSQLQHDCHWCGVLINEADSAIVEQDLQRYHIKYQHCQRFNQGKMPTSYITLSEATGSRSIVHYRDCPELPFAHFSQLDLSGFDWLHFEGRNIDELSQMLQWVKLNYPALRCSLEVEKPREGIETLFDLADVLMFSRPYAESRGFQRADDFLHSLSYQALMTCTWGNHGAWLKQDGIVSHSPSFPPPRVVDTLGAGDTFNAGLISALVNGQPARAALEQACRLAGHKCGQAGFANLNELL
ncbi:PfkB family carbohydrate kinase [Methylophaga sp.]|jgi:ketohexokinase|uniref:PfkB family carbohydrate kinase n=1 Tax=Methylophaga sp. TaxID=2024840 RepID=UPI0014007462|nr:PfkB family carbohydrate kinase [Methylophaga sp.]MTI63197.1 ketohexokinase [Methylophaga sp.]